MLLESFFYTVSEKTFFNFPMCLVHIFVNMAYAARLEWVITEGWTFWRLRQNAKYYELYNVYIRLKGIQAQNSIMRSLLTALYCNACWSTCVRLCCVLPNCVILLYSWTLLIEFLESTGILIKPKFNTVYYYMYAVGLAGTMVLLIFCQGFNIN